MEQEESTKSLSVEQLGMIDVQDAMSAHPPPTCFFLQLQVFFFKNFEARQCSISTSIRNFSNKKEAASVYG